ncbi:hypothetical protein [uncultured Aquimonas sp.]|uniref:tetratricopeptide repeat protein n=1 Tax=uncultured Aquimonas sp. TaxID=385483 RepID=UPI00261E4CA1|nr:hypothetical protein [uncultured Aquimonas sp.]
MSSIKYPYPNNEDEFEDLVSDLLEAQFKPPLPPTRFGRRGQRQDGVDITWIDDQGMHRAAQCKFYINKALTPSAINQDVLKAHNIRPQLRSLIFATSLPRDRALTDHARTCKLHGCEGAVEIWFWEDIEAFLDRHTPVAARLVRPSVMKHLHLVLKEDGLALVSTSSLSIQPLNTSAHSELEQEVSALLGTGRLNELFQRLTTKEIDSSDALRLTLARAHFQRGDYDDVLRIAERYRTQPSLLALAALVHARSGRITESRQASLEASQGARKEELPYITALGFSAACARGEVDYRGLLELVPEALKGHPVIESALGDAAQSEGNDEAAILHYTNALDCDPRPNILRRIALLSARLSRCAAQLPLASFAIEQPNLVSELISIRNELIAENRDELHPEIRCTLIYNLGVASGLLDDRVGAVDFARQALSISSNKTPYWLRYALVLGIYGLGIEPDLAEKAPRDNAPLQLMLADLERRQGNLAGARERNRIAMSLPELDPETAARLEAQRIELEDPSLDQNDRFNRLIELAETSPFPTPFFSRAIETGRLATEEMHRLVASINKADFENTDIVERASLAGMLIERGILSAAVRFIDDLRCVQRRDNGDLDVGVAGVLTSLLLYTRRLTEAEALTDEWCQSSPQSVYARSARTRVLVAAGKPEMAVDELLNSPSVLSCNAVILGQTTALAKMCGRLSELRRLLKKINAPEAVTSNDRRALLFALSATKSTLHLEQLAISSLRPDADLSDIAAGLLCLSTTGQRNYTSPVARPNCAITVEHPSQGLLKYWIGPSSPPIVGLGRGDWLTTFIGRTSGDYVTPDSGPFSGTTFMLIDIKPPLALLNEHAQQQGRADGHLRGYSGEPSELIPQIHEQLRVHQQATQKSLELGGRVGMPAVIMASALGGSPREFLHASQGWTPLCHTGSADDFAREDRAVERLDGWVIDGATICIIVEANLREVFSNLKTRLYVTRETLAALREWYMHERSTFRSAGVMSSSQKGKIRLREFDSASRREHRRFWSRVHDFVENETILAERADDETSAEFSQFRDTLDTGTISCLATAKALGLGYLTDELAIRQVFALPFGVEAVSLRAFLMKWFQAGIRESPGYSLAAVRAFARLAGHGRKFQSIPVASPFASLYASASERSQLISDLLSTTATAEASFWKQGLLLIAKNHALRAASLSSGIRPRKLLSIVLRSLPKLPAEQMSHLAELIERDWRTVDRSTRRAVVRWLRKRVG